MFVSFHSFFIRIRCCRISKKFKEYDLLALNLALNAIETSEGRAEDRLRDLPKGLGRGGEEVELHDPRAGA